MDSFQVRERWSKMADVVDIVSDEEFIVLDDEEEGEIPETPKKQFVDLESSLSDIRCCPFVLFSQSPLLYFLCFP